MNPVTIVRYMLVLMLWNANVSVAHSASNTALPVKCPTEIFIRLGERAVLKCEGLVDFNVVFWINSTREDVPAFIQKVNGDVKGIGYTTGEFDIDNEGSLVIKRVKLQDERTFRVKFLDPMFNGGTYFIRVVVYVEPSEPTPVVPDCFGQSTCILKGDSGRVISCIHGESKPAMEVSWFLRVGIQDQLLNDTVNHTVSADSITFTTSALLAVDVSWFLRVGIQDQLLNATVNHMVSADSITFTTSALLAVDKIPVDANMNQLVVLVCKSNQPIPGAKGSQREVLLDVSVDIPFTNEENLDPVYAIERQEDFIIKCQSGIDTKNNVILWKYKPLNRENVENILYSAYGEVSFTSKGDTGFNLTDDGGLVIKQVDRHHKGSYACVSRTAVSFVKNLKVIVLPKPPRIVVKGCEPFQPCHLSAQEAEVITCTVNGVRPRVDLSIATYATNVLMNKTTVRSNKINGLFYTTVEGTLDVSKNTCRQNVTVICQARGPAAYGFMSDAYVTVSVDGEECIDSLTAAVLPDDDGSKYGLLAPIPIIVAVLVIVFTAVTCFLCGSQFRKIHPYLTRPKNHHNVDKKENAEL